MNRSRTMEIEATLPAPAAAPCSRRRPRNSPALGDRAQPIEAAA